MPNPLEAALTAAKLAAEKAALGATRPELLKLAHHTTVLLSPTTIVARVQQVDRSGGRGDGIARELAIASHLASRGGPTVRPASSVDPGPYFENGCAISLWQFVAGRRAETKSDTRLAANSLREVHDALTGIALPLPSFTIAFESCEAILGSSPAPAMLNSSDRVFLQNLYAELRTELSRYEMEIQPLHGDAHLGNVLIGASGAIWMDLDDVCVGPVEWDVASLPRDAWSEFPGIDRELVTLLANLRSLCVSVWCWADFERSEETAEAAMHHLRTLKRRFAHRRTGLR